MSSSHTHIAPLTRVLVALARFALLRDCLHVHPHFIFLFINNASRFVSGGGVNIHMPPSLIMRIHTSYMLLHIPHPVLLRTFRDVSHRVCFFPPCRFFPGAPFLCPESFDHIRPSPQNRSRTASGRDTVPLRICRSDLSRGSTDFVSSDKQNVIHCAN